jgi:hypothetical protein
VSDWFIKARAYVEHSGMPWFILSAEHGLVLPDAMIAPYDKTLKHLRVNERRAWADNVIRQMEQVLPPAETVIILAGVAYREFLMDYLRGHFPKVEVPMDGLSIGKQLSWLTRH